MLQVYDSGKCHTIWASCIPPRKYFSAVMTMYHQLGYIRILEVIRWGMAKKRLRNTDLNADVLTFNIKSRSKRFRKLRENGKFMED